MTDRINTLTVVLEQPIRDDDCQELIAAIKLLRGVLTVEANVANPSDYAAQSRALLEIRRKLLAVLYEGQLEA